LAHLFCFLFLVKGQQEIDILNKNYLLFFKEYDKLIGN
jgi:hypothetical protein